MSFSCTDCGGVVCSPAGTFEKRALMSLLRPVRHVRLGCAPCKGGAFQWVQAPPGNRSNRKQLEQSWIRRWLISAG
jgi:hypothetical protein